MNDKINHFDLKSPCFIIDKNKLDENINNIINGCNILENNVIISYSLKTNPVSYLIKYLNKKKIHIEVVSEDEYNYALSLGVRGENIIYNGPIKSKKSLIKALTKGSIVNIDSYAELEWLLESNLKNKKIGIRVNVPIDDDIKPFFDSSEKVSRFGFDIINDKSLSEYFYRLKKEKNIVINSLHFHCNTTNRNTLIYKKIITYCDSILNNFDLQLDYLDIGGGFLGGNENNFITYTNVIKKALEESNNLKDINIIIEPGAAIIATAVSYYCKITNKKIINGYEIITIDGSRIHVDPTFSNKKYNYLSSCSQKSQLPIIVCGFTCMEKDKINIGENLEFKIGDYILFNRIGAYTMSFIANFINSYPNVYIYNGSRILLIKKKRKLRRYLK